MNEQVEKYTAPIKAFWGKQSKKKKTTWICVLAGIIVLSFVIVLVLNSKEYTVLFEGISQEESVEVLQSLSAGAIDYKAENGGRKILVDKAQEPLIRMQMASAGHPRTAPNYDFFKDSVDFMTTESEKRTFKIYQLNERMKSSIETIQGVKQAIVTINAPEDNGWAWEEDKLEASASVMLSLNGGVTLSPSQVDGIKSLVSTSVPGLTKEKISVVDSTGNELQSSTTMNYVDINNFKLEIENKFQEDVRKNIIKAIGPVFGTENIAVTAKSTMAIQNKIKEAITYTPSTEDEKGILSESEVDKEAVRPDGTVGGVAGAETNTDIPGYAGITEDGNNIYYKDYENYKYLVNKVTEQITNDAAELQDLTVSVVINKTKRVLSDTDIEQLLQIVANSAGVSPAKVAILNSEFEISPNDPLIPGGTSLLENQVFVFGVGGGTLLLLIILIVVAVLNRKAKKKKAAELAAALEAANAVAHTTAMPDREMPNMMEDLKNVPESKEQVLRKEIQDFSGKNPEIAAQLLRTWLKGDDSDA